MAQLSQTPRIRATHDTPNKAAFRRFEDAVNGHDWDLISKTIDEVFEPDVRMQTPLPIQSTGTAAIREVFATLLRGYPDLHITVEDFIEEGDKVVARNTVQGTHQGDHMGLSPTGKSVTYNEIFILRFVDGRIAETWGVVDVLSQMKQLGALGAS
ncbi:MAG TPA: ester cyclase [Acidimicrobiales bacterium]|jgi:hypothetical protein